LTKKAIAIELLVVGMFIELPLKWSRHPFLMNRFKLRSQEQIQTLKQIGLKKVWYYPEKSDAKPREEAVEIQAPADDEGSQTNKALWDEKVARLKILRERRRAIQKTEKRYKATLKVVKSLMLRLSSRPQQSVDDAKELMQEMASNLLSDNEVVIHLMNENNMDESSYYHSLNVAILSMMMGASEDIDKESLSELGLAALFHDIGKSKVPTSILRKREPWNKAERSFYEMHTRYGFDMAEKIEALPACAQQVIVEHHERLNGEGFPYGLKEADISDFSKIVAIANIYDNHCNHLDPRDSMTPHEALSYMFNKQKAWFDPVRLQRFVKMMGVYPPGTIVQLNDGSVGIVITLNSKKILYPRILVYDKNIPKEEAIIFDLDEEPDLNIVKSIRLGKLPKEIHEYLNPRVRVSYFYEAQKKERKL